jgi:hypothetical protein
VAEAAAAESLNPEHAVTDIVADADHMFSRDEQRRYVSRKVVDWFNRVLSPGIL